MTRLTTLACLFLPLALHAGEQFSQRPTTSPSQAQGDAQQRPRPDLLAGGPKPTWIWGESADRNYFLKAEFEGSAEAAELIATCDNRMSVSLNGATVADGDDWGQPVRADLSKHLRDGKNTILVKAENQGSAAAFALKLALRTADGKTRYVVSDDTWVAAEKADADSWKPVTTHGQMGVGPWGDVFSQPPSSSPRGVFITKPGFKVEKLFTVPRDKLGSWVCITFGPDGKLYASDEGNKGICRITPAPLDGSAPTTVEKLDLPITAAQGMLFAFGHFYLSVNGGPGSGFYRATDTDKDGEFDKVEKLKDLRGGGEHGPHALRLSPDGKSIFLIAGNHTQPPENFDHSRLPSNWGEDLLLPRMWDANGHARGIMAPGGWIARTDKDGKSWEIWSAGYRNAYDMAFNADGELFAYDADMEWDMGTPWYRPTRLVHATSGSEFGWRSGTGKWPTYYPDSLPPVVDIGPGSPVGVEFGYGTRFPAKYQKALYLLDWTFGTMYAIHLTPKGASYTGEKEEFLSRTPLPLTDAAVGPDGALYFTIGGRGTQSELYRIVYAGDEPTDPADTHDVKGAELRESRADLERYHDTQFDAKRPKPVGDLIADFIGHEDRFIRYAARVVLELREPLNDGRLLSKLDTPDERIQFVIALARWPGFITDSGWATFTAGSIFSGLDFAKLTREQRLNYLRALSLVIIRFGEPDDAARATFSGKLEPHYPADDDDLNRELSRLLVYLRSPSVIDKTLALMAKRSDPATGDLAELLARNPGYGRSIAGMLDNPPDTQKLHYALILRTLKFGWTLEQRKQYFDWLADARTKNGGNSYRKFIDNIRQETWDNMTDAERKALESEVTVVVEPEALPKPHGPGKEWSLAELVKLTRGGLQNRDFEGGRRAYAAARCIVCHRFAGDGGATGPDLTNAAGRFSYADMAEALVEPSKVISDQYRASVVTTLNGQTVTGRLVEDSDEKVTVLTDPEDPTKVAEFAKDDVDEVVPSPTSLMPADLLKPLNQDEVLDLMAYVMSRGDRNDPIFRRKGN